MTVRYKALPMSNADIKETVFLCTDAIRPTKR